MAITNIAIAMSGTLICSARHQKLFNFGKIPLFLTLPCGQHESFVFPCRARIGFLCGLPAMAIGLLSFYLR
jgi:hypothetical protein